MRVSARSVSALIAFCASTAWAQTQQTVINPVAPSGPIYITHVTVIDTETGKEFRDRTVHISGDRISEVKESKDLALPTGVKIVDGTNKYLIPGLWDMHVHGTRFDSTLPLYIANGVTGVREMFGPPDADKFRAELAAKHLIAPHIYLASPIVDGKPPIVPNSIEVATADEARRAVDEQKQRGADFIKVYSLLSRDAYFAIIDEARRQNIPVDGHVPNSVTVLEAAAAKQRTIEHSIGIELACSSREKDLRPKFLTANPFKNEGDALLLEAWQSYSDERCKSLFAELKKNGTWPVPTLTVWRSVGLMNDPQFTSDNRVRYFSGEFRDWVTGKADARMKEWSASEFGVRREIFTAESKLTDELFRAGVPMLAGTDVGNPFCFPGFSLHDELALLVESGVSPLGALQMATRNPARFMGATDKYGSVTPGKIADLVLLDADPLQDIHNTTKIAEVFLDGQEINRAALDGILKTAETKASASDQLPSSTAQPASETQSVFNTVSERPDGQQATFLPAKQLLADIRKAPEQRPGISRVDYLDAPPYTAAVLRRTAPDRSEVHKDLTEIQYVIEGHGSLVTGGSLVEAVETEPGEFRGRGIVGGEERYIASGDLIVIPAGTPHWIRRIEGNEMVYLSVKSTSADGGLRNDAAVATGSPQSANSPQPPLEMQSLANAFEGNWRISEKYEPDEWTPNGGVGYGEEVWRRGPGGFTFMEEVHDFGPTRESFGLGLAWWDKDKGFQGIWCENHNPHDCDLSAGANFKWDGKQQVIDNEFQRDGKTFRWHEVLTDVTPTSFVQTADIGEKGGPLKRWLTIHATRILAEPMNHSSISAVLPQQTMSPSPEVQKILNSQLGTWSMHAERPDGAPGEGVATWRPGPGAMSLISDERLQDSKGEMFGHSVTWWDDTEKGYRALWCDNRIKNGCLVMAKLAHWEGDQFVLRDEFEQNGKKFTFKEVESEIQPNAYRLSTYIGESGTELKRTSTIHASRMTESAQESAKAIAPEAELRATLGQIRKASLEGDSEAIASLLADEYLQTDISGYVQDKTTWLNEYFNPLAELIKSGKFRWELYDRQDLRFQFYGDGAIVIGNLQAKGTGAKLGPQHTWVTDPTASFSGTLRFTHVYIKRQGRWLLAALHNQLPPAPTETRK